MQPVDFLLTAEQHMIIQHHLPKRYSLIDFKNIKRSFSSVLKLGGEEVCVDIYVECVEIIGQC